MRSRFAMLVVLAFLPVSGIGEETDERYNRLVDEMLEVTGALKIGEQMSAFMISEMSRALKDMDTNLPDRAYEVIESEVNSAIEEAIESGSLNELMYPIYRRHLDAADLEAAIRFYRSKEGKKIASALPQLTQEGMLAGQEWGASLGAEIGERVTARLLEEGIEVP